MAAKLRPRGRALIQPSQPRPIAQWALDLGITHAWQAGASEFVSTPSGIQPLNWISPGSLAASVSLDTGPEGRETTGTQVTAFCVADINGVAMTELSCGIISSRINETDVPVVGRASFGDSNGFDYLSSGGTGWQFRVANGSASQAAVAPGGTYLAAPPAYLIGTWRSGSPVRCYANDSFGDSSALSGTVTPSQNLLVGVRDSVLRSVRGLALCWFGTRYIEHEAALMLQARRYEMFAQRRRYVGFESAGPGLPTLTALARTNLRRPRATIAGL
jgi:hypothetical protein